MPQTTSCQNCKQAFTIEPNDFTFYEKIKVPPPTFCPECRMVRRFMWRNERSLYKRKCDVSGHSEDVVSIYARDKDLKVYDRDYWWRDAWDVLDSGRAYDFTKPLFGQFEKLLKTAPLPDRSEGNSTNLNYCNIIVNSKNCYLVYACWDSEDCMYSTRIANCRESLDLYTCNHCEYNYENTGCKDSYKLFFSRDSVQCRESYFLYNCRNCSNCVGCANLRNKHYCVFNKQFSKDVKHPFFRTQSERFFASTFVG